MQEKIAERRRKGETEVGASLGASHGVAFTRGLGFGLGA
jgi:hypothetical protein